MNRDELAKVLAAHQDLLRGPDYWYCGNPECDALIAEGVESQYAAKSAFLSHQADAILDWFKTQATEEWGAQYESDSFVYETSDDKDWLIDECITGVYDEGETPPKLMSRWTTAWKETR